MSAHLIPEVAAVLDRPTPEREERIKSDVWIGYPRAQQILNALEDLLSHPKTLRMPNLLLVGDSGNGKSTVVDHFYRSNGPITEGGEAPTVPIVLMEMPSEPNEGRFWTSMLDSMFIAHRSTDPVTRKEAQAVSVLRGCRTRMLIIDEIHNLLYGSPLKQRHFLGVLKNLSNRLQLPIVAVGTRDSVRALHTDSQLSSRFEPMALRRWEINRDYRALLAAFEKLIPLAKPSGLADNREVAIKIHSLSGGTIGGISGILKKAALQAVRTGKEKIDMDCLKGIEWVRLNEYGRSADTF